MVGNTLTVFDGTWTPADAKLTHQWLRNDVPVLGAVGPTYKLTSRNDIGKGIRVKTTATAPGYQAVTVKSAKTGPVTNVGGAVPMVKAPAAVTIGWAGDNEDEPSNVLAASSGLWPTPGIRSTTSGCGTAHRSPGRTPPGSTKPAGAANPGTSASKSPATLPASIR